MNIIDFKKFRYNLDSVVEKATKGHQSFMVIPHAGEDFMVVSAEDETREQETLYVLQNQNLMQQTSISLKSYKRPQERIYDQ